MYMVLLVAVPSAWLVTARCRPRRAYVRVWAGGTVCVCVCICMGGARACLFVPVMSVVRLSLPLSRITCVCNMYLVLLVADSPAWLVAARRDELMDKGTLSGSMRLASRSAPISHISISSIEIHRHLRSLKYSSMGYSCVYPDKDRIHPS